MSIEGYIVSEMKKVAKLHNLPEDILENSIKLFKMLHQEGFVIGHDSINIAKACLYYMAKLDPSCPAISLQGFAEGDSRTKRKIWIEYSRILTEKGIQPQVCTMRPKIFVKSFGQKIGFRKEALDFALKLADDSVKKKAHMGRSPSAWAAACLYSASLKFGEGITGEEITEVSGVTETSIRNTRKNSFFLRLKYFNEAPQFVTSESLRTLIHKLLLNYPEGIQLSQLRQALRCSFANELKGFMIPASKLYIITEYLESEGLIKRTSISSNDYLIQLK
jgi:transcription initiation factor TFIIIB Brf1 subunit/transcription initiation factor TFIIB